MLATSSRIRGDVDGALRLHRHLRSVLGRRAHADPLCVAEDGDVGVVGCKQELSFRLGRAQFLDDALRDEGVVEVVFPVDP